jgi:hypothetical protein
VSGRSRSFVKAIDPVLSTAGFRRHGRVWIRPVDANTVDAVGSPDGKLRSSVTVNLGVVDVDVFNAWHTVSLPPFPNAAHATVQSRLAFLTGPFDTWWQVDDPAASADAIEKLETFGLPFIDKMHDRRSMLSYLQGRPSYWPDVASRASLEFRLGLRREACESLEAWRRDMVRHNRGQAVIRRIDQLLEEWGCGAASSHDT